MANTSHIPATGLSGFRSEALAKNSAAKLEAVAPAQNPAANETNDSATLPVTGPRKLVRPTLPARSFRNRAFRLREEPAILAHQNASATANHESSHAEAFYFQKQVQAQTPMVIVLEDGEQIEGCIEWYDRNAIKVKGSTRTLVYKSGIKYIYKAGEKHA
jgi:sRNA-binding regulator protein Hfq